MLLLPARASKSKLPLIAKHEAVTKACARERK